MKAKVSGRVRGSFLPGVNTDTAVARHDHIMCAGSWLGGAEISEAATVRKRHDSVVSISALIFEDHCNFHSRSNLILTPSICRL